MKKNYFMVLVALFIFALSAFAQEEKWQTVTAPEDTEAQSETYNMVITLPDGTTFTVNTDDVNEVQFSNGKVTLSGTSIQQLLDYCESIQAEQDKLLGTVHALVTDESVLHVLLEDNKRAYQELQDYVKDLANKLDTLNVSGEAFSGILDGYATQAELATTLSDINTRLAQLSSDLYVTQADLQIDINNLKMDVLQNGITINDVKNQLAASDSRLNTLDGKYAGLDNRLTDIEGKVTTNTVDIAWFKSLLTELNGKIADLNANSSKYISRDEFNAAIAALQEQINNQGNNGNSGTINGREWVDLGLPSGTKWATCNVGASKPEEYGDYFAWGETTTKSTYNWSTYFDTDDGGKTFKKYNIFNDGLGMLKPADDAAAVNWGSGWQMPSEAQIDELYNSSYTTTELMHVNGVYGLKITSKTNGNSIFLPAAGARSDTSLYNAGSDGNYWSSSLDPANDDRAGKLGFSSGDWNWEPYTRRYYGLSVRAVRVP